MDVLHSGPGWRLGDCSAAMCRRWMELRLDQAHSKVTYGVLILNLFSEMIFSRMCFQLVYWWNHRWMYVTYTFSSLMCHCREDRCTRMQYVRTRLIFVTTNVREPGEVTSLHPGDWQSWGGVRMLKGEASTCIISSSICCKRTHLKVTFLNKWN